MNTKTLSPRALSVIDQYAHFHMGSAVCSVPYFNNKVARARAGLRADIGKGSPGEIFEEVRAIAVKSHVNPETLADESLKKLLVDNNIGVDCSSLAYYILNAESEETKKGSLERHVSFVNCHGIVGKIRCSLRPVENCDVATLAHDKNSRAISVKEAMPGDMITTLGGPDNNDRDHILVIHQVEYQNFIPTKIHYTHVMAYPEDGLYGSGVKQGTIEIADADKMIIENRWTEDGKEGLGNRIFARASKAETGIRRLAWF